ADGVVGEEAAELLVELGGEGLVVGEDEGGPVEGRDDVSRGHGLAGAGGPEQALEALAGSVALDQLQNGLGLVAGGLKIADELELGGHAAGPSARYAGKELVAYLRRWRKRRSVAERDMIRRVKFENFKALRDVEISFDERLTVLVGPNGSGKS